MVSLDSDDESRMGRRRLLKLAGTGAATTLAGCTEGGGQNDGTETGDTVSPTGTTADTVAEGDRKAGGTLTVGMESKLTGLDPHKTASVVSWNVIYSVCETLTTFEDGKLAGRLVEDYETSDGGKTYTFKLKEGVMFHPPVDRELVADDVVYSFERMQGEEAQMSGDVSKIESMEAKSEYEVSFTLDSVFAPFIQFLARVPWVVVPEEAVEDQGGSIGDFQKPVGTGPFVFEEHVSGDHTTLTKFEDYREDGVPYLDEVRFLPVPDADSRVLALKKGNIDFARQTPGKDAGSLDENDDVRIVESKAAAWGQVFINNSESPWDDPAVRQAVAHVFNREAVVQAGLYGYGSAAWQPYPKSSFWYTEQEEARKRDVEKAKQILNDAGNPLEGETLEIKTTGAYQIMSSTADILVNNLNEAGIDAEINTMEWGTMLNDFLEGNFGAMAFSIPHKVDPDRYYFNFLHPDSPQYLKYGEDQPDAQRMYELMDKGRTTTDQDERKKIYGELQGLVNKNVPWISVALRSNVLGLRSNVQGNPNWLLPYNRFWKLSIDE